MDTSKKKKTFMNETVARPEARKLRIFRRILFTFALALVFGLTASLTFVVSRPMWEDRFGETDTSESITIFREETTTSPDPDKGTDGVATEPPVTGSPDDWQDAVREMIDDYMIDIQVHDAIYTAKNDVVNTAAKSLVTVTAQQTDTDWFDNEVSSNKETSGVIIAVTNYEILILVDSYLLDESELVRVDFGDFGSATAYVKQMDSVNKIAVVAVAVRDVGESVTDQVQPIVMGNSYTCVQGQPVIAIGRPMGYNRSVAYGIISYINSNASGVDSLMRLIQTDIPAGEGAGGMLINTDGELIGWLTTEYSSGSTDGFLTAISLWDLRTVIEKMSNGEAMAILGIQGQNVTEEISEEQGIPTGVYVTKCLTDEPAYLAGMQSGDILTAVDDTMIVSLKDLQTCMEGLKPGDVVTAAVKRAGSDGYTEFTFGVTLQAR